MDVLVSLISIICGICTWLLARELQAINRLKGYAFGYWVGWTLGVLAVVHIVVTLWGPYGPL